jgi:hypothetical protein
MIDSGPSVFRDRLQHKQEEYYMIRQWDEFPLSPDTKEVISMRASLSPRGIISINRAAHKAMGQSASVVLLFDKINSVIGLRPAPPQAPNAFKLNQTGRAGSFLIRAKKFCNYYGIRTTATVTFNNIVSDEDATLTLDLRDTTEFFRKPK